MKLDSDPASTQVRVCERDAAGNCSSWLFEGSLGAGQRVPICAGGGMVVYQELDLVTQSYAPPIEARCDEDVDVEL